MRSSVSAPKIRRGARRKSRARSPRCKIGSHAVATEVGMPELDDPIVVYTGTAWQAEELQGLLEDGGIEAYLRDEVMGRIDAPALLPGAIGAVKLVVRREDQARAEALLREFGGRREVSGESEAAALAPPAPWVCVHCGEQCEGQFDVCWNCSAARGD